MGFWYMLWFLLPFAKRENGSKGLPVGETPTRVHWKCLEGCFDGVSPNIPEPTPKDCSNFVCLTLDTTDQKYDLKLRLFSK